MTETRTDAEILRAARDRIADQGHFVMGALAWNRRGREVDPTDPTAWRWNARGALWVESGRRPLPFKELARDRRFYRLLDQAALALLNARGVRFPAGTNVDDNLGHALTLQALEDAAVMAEAEAPPAPRTAGATAP